MDPLPHIDPTPTRYDQGRPTESPCPTCNGGSDGYYNTPGRERDAPCPTCRGYGVVRAARPLPVPPAAEPRRPWWAVLLRLLARLLRLRRR